MIKVPCYIISYNRPTFLKRTLDELIKNERLEIIIIDNGSTSEPLLDYYNQIKHGVEIRMYIENHGHTAPWKLDITKECKDTPYIVTDCDILVDKCKDDYLEVLEQGLIDYPEYNKIGLGLNTNKIPSGYANREKVINHENRVLYKKEIGSPTFFECAVDTTFAIYRGGYHSYSVWGTELSYWGGVCKSLRTNPPYQATHLGWHIVEPTDEDKFYFESIKDQESGTWRV